MPSLTETRDHAELLVERAWPRAWRGQWIGPYPIPDASIDLGVIQPSGGFARHLFRRSVTLTEAPETAPLRITADSRYVLIVNGTEVGRGPVRSQPRRLHYDSYDIASLLQEGDNTIVVLVTYFGQANAFWQPAAGTANFGRHGVLVLEADLGGTPLISDAAWEVQDARAWSDSARHGIEGIPVEVLDARLLDPDWRRGTGGEWRPVVVQPASHLGGLARTSPPTDPYGALLPRPIGPFTGETVRPISASLADDAVEFPDLDGSPVATVRAFLQHSVGTASAVDPGTIAFTAEAGRSRTATLDFGRIVAGRAAVEIDAPAGTVIDVMCREVAPTSVDETTGVVPGTGFRYIARGSNDRFEAQELLGFRYAHILVTSPDAGAVELRDFRVAEELTRRTGSSFFRSSDAQLNALYAAGIRTVEVNSFDAYTDCPTREQRAWVGDGNVHQMVTLTTSDDWRLAHRYIDLGNSPRADGILPMTVVGEIENSQGHTIPDWSLYWIHGLHTLHRYSRDTAAIREAAATARRILAWFEPYVDDGDVLADVPEWTLVDWSSILLSGKSSILTALWAAELREFAEISDHLGNAGDAAWARALWERARGGYAAFWDEARGTYIDHIVDGVSEAAASQLAGALAIVSGLAPAEHVDRVIAWISDPQRQVVRSWIGGEGGYDTTKMVENIQGIQRIDWDADAETVIAQPFASFLVHDAYAVAGRPDLIVDNMRKWSVYLHDGYDTFGECWGWGTPAHGWSSTPTRDLVQRVAGVMPDAPGFGRARIAPAFGTVEHLEASVPSPAGAIRVELDGEHVAVGCPVPFTLVHADGTETTHEAGAVRS